MDYINIGEANQSGEIGYNEGKRTKNCVTAKIKEGVTRTEKERKTWTMKHSKKGNNEKHKEENQ